jgi:hypothetical protein
MSPTTYFGQHLGNISSIMDSYQPPYSSSSGHFLSDVFTSPGTYISQRPGDISSIISYQHPIEHNYFTHHNLQSNGPAGFDIQNSGTRSTHNTGNNVTNVGIPYFSGHVGEVSSIDPMNYSISSTPCPSNGFLTWAPGATSTPISSGNILTSRRSQIADHQKKIIVTRLSGPRSRSTTSQKIW